MQHINDSLIRKITWIFCPGHAGVAGNERVDKLAGEAAISDNKVLLDPQAFVGMVASHMSDVQDNKPSSSHTLQVIKDSGTKRGAGVNVCYVAQTDAVQINFSATQSVFLH